MIQHELPVHLRPGGGHRSRAEMADRRLSEETLEQLMEDELRVVIHIKQIKADIAARQLMR